MTRPILKERVRGAFARDRCCRGSRRSRSDSDRRCTTSGRAVRPRRRRRRSMPLPPPTAEARSLRPFAITGDASSSNDVWLGPARCAMNRFCCASCGLIGVTFAGCSSCETSSSLTRAILVPRLARVAVREQAVSGEVRRVVADRAPSVDATRAVRIRARCARGRARRCASRGPRRAGATSRRSADRRSCARPDAGPATPRRADWRAVSAATSTTKASDRRDRNPWRDRVGWPPARRGARRRRPWPCSCASTRWPDRGRRRARAGAALR